MPVDAAVVQWLNTLVRTSASATSVSVFLASVLIVVIALCSFVVAMRASRGDRFRRVRDLALTSIGAYALNALIGAIAFRPRPFAVGEAIALIEKSAAEKSFPSDHATLAFAFVLPILPVLRTRVAKAIAVVAASGVGVGRVLVGVHYPSDVLAGVASAFMVWFAVRRVARRLDAERN